MRKEIIIIFAIIFKTSIASSQVEQNANGGFGFGLGTKMYFGGFGATYNYNISPFKRRIELNAGIGINLEGDATFAYGLGTKCRIFNYQLPPKEVLQNIIIFASFDYSYRHSGKVSYSTDTKPTDIYNVSSNQYLYYCLTGRYLLGGKVAFQLNCGYRQNISGYTIEHTIGLDEHYNSLNRSLGNGLVLGAEVIVFLKPKDFQKSNIQH